MIASCHNNKKKNVFDTSTLSSYTIEFLNSELWLPPNYDKFTYDELFEMSKVNDNEAINFLLQSSKEYRSKKLKPIFFKDRLADENVIVIFPMPYQVMDKATASGWISGTIGNMKSMDQFRGSTTEIVEKKIKKFGGHQMIKFKVKQVTRMSGKSRYFSQYYITGNLNSFMVINIDVYGKDIENNLKALSLSSK